MWSWFLVLLFFGITYKFWAFQVAHLYLVFSSLFQDLLQRPNHSDEASLQWHQLKPNHVANPEYFESSSSTHNPTTSKHRSSVTPAPLYLHISEPPRIAEPSCFDRRDSLECTEMVCGGPAESEHDYYNEFGYLGSSSPPAVDHLVKESPIWLRCNIIVVTAFRLSGSWIDSRICS